MEKRKRREIKIIRERGLLNWLLLPKFLVNVNTSAIENLWKCFTKIMREDYILSYWIFCTRFLLHTFIFSCHNEQYSLKDRSQYLLDFFFFFHWHYSPLWALACRTMSFHFFPICHQLSPSSHSQHLKISFYFLFPSFSGSSPSSRPFQFLSEDLFEHPILLHSLQVT